jgi:hypothetical protein
MAITNITDMADQVQKFWSPLFEKELRENTLLPGLVSKSYQGDLKRAGDTVYVTEWVVPKGQRKNKTTDADYDTFSPQKIQENRVAITADTIISAAVEIEDLADLQSQLGDADSVIRQGLMKSIEIQLNDFLYSKVSPSTSAPDHSIDSIADFNAARIGAHRVLASQAKWPMDGQWYMLLDPVYMQDVLNATTMTSQDYVSGQPTVGGRIVTPRFGWNLIEDNSAGSDPLGMARLSPTNATSDLSLAFHPSFMNLVIQKEPTFELARQTANHRFGYVLVAHMVCGAALSNQGDVLHIVTYNA